MSRFHAHVANRVQSIRESTDVKAWRYIDTDSKSADIASRGMSGPTAPPGVFTKRDLSIVDVDGCKFDNYLAYVSSHSRVRSTSQTLHIYIPLLHDPPCFEIRI